MGLITHIARVLMDNSYRKLTTFQIPNLSHHEVILEMPWLKEHNPMIDRNEKKIIFNRK